MEKSNLELSNILMNILNDNFIIDYFLVNNQNVITFRAVNKNKKGKDYKRYIIVNNQILEINKNVKTYTYSFNGIARKGCKNIMELTYKIEDAIYELNINTFKGKFIEEYIEI